MRALKTGWWLFRRCAEVCGRLNAYADRVIAIAACLSGRNDRSDPASRAVPSDVKRDRLAMARALRAPRRCAMTRPPAPAVPGTATGGRGAPRRTESRHDGTIRR